MGHRDGRPGRFLRLLSLCFFALPALAALSACSPSSPVDLPDGELENLEFYEVPEDLSDGLGSAHADDRGIDPVALDEMVEEIEAGLWSSIRSLLIYRSGDLVLEEYFPGNWNGGEEIFDWDRGSLKPLMSVTKSITSAAVGMAIDDGFIEDVDVPVVDFFPDYEELGGSLASGELLLHHMLSMSTGLEWPELDLPFGHPDHLVPQMTAADDQIEFVFSLPTAGPPGSTFNYNSGVSVVLGEIVTRATGEDVAEYVERKLFDPLGVPDYEWRKYETSGITTTGGGLTLRSRDMAKFGVLYLNEGLWQGERILPAEWVRESTTQQAPDWGYGYQWWLGYWTVGGEDLTGYMAIGVLGQYVYVVPDLDLVVVFNSAADLGEPPVLFETVILPAVE